MLLLPTGPSSSWATEHHPTYSLHTLMGVTPGFQALAILRILSSENLAETFGDSSYEAKMAAYYTPRYWKPMVAAMVAAHLDPENTLQIATGIDDVFCNTCDHFVSHVLEEEHWDLLCGICTHHSDECECCEKCQSRECECCQTCDEAPGWCNCCSHCGQAEGYCECPECRDCGYTTPNCCCYSGGSIHKFGQTKTAPWEQRPDAPMERTLPKISDCDNENIDPVQSAADFYLLDAIKGMVRFADIQDANERIFTEKDRAIQGDSLLSALRLSATKEYDRLVERLAPNFLAYSIAAVGGELRYHRACSGTSLPASRDKAWKKFTKLVELKGAEVLFEADKLFNEFGSSSYGGKKWGDAAKVVGMYLKGSMPDWLFIDRVFTLQHNGGCFLNKVEWSRDNKHRWGLGHMENVLNAHAGKDRNGHDAPTDWDLLAEMASPEVRDMFRMTERGIARLARRWGGFLPGYKPSRYRSYGW